MTSQLMSLINSRIVFPIWKITLTLTQNLPKVWRREESQSECMNLCGSLNQKCIPSEFAKVSFFSFFTSENQVFVMQPPFLWCFKMSEFGGFNSVVIKSSIHCQYQGRKCPAFLQEFQPSNICLQIFTSSNLLINF